MKTTTIALMLLALVSQAKAESVGSKAEGKALGKNNGALMAERLYKRTVGLKGCSALGQYQDALNAVSARVRPYGGAGSQFTAGFYLGYAESIKEAVKGARKECSRSRFETGAFPGEFFANLFCQVAAVEPEALNDLPFGPIYDGWSGDEETRNDCKLVFSLVTTDCATSGIAAQLLGQAQASACAE